MLQEWDLLVKVEFLIHPTDKQRLRHHRQTFQLTGVSTLFTPCYKRMRIDVTRSVKINIGLLTLLAPARFGAAAI